MICKDATSPAERWTYLRRTARGCAQDDEVSPIPTVAYRR